MSDIVNQKGVQLLTAHKCIKGQSWWKGKFIWDAGNWSGSGRWTLVQRLTSPFPTPPLSTWAPLSPSHTPPAPRVWPLTISGQEFYRWREGNTCRESTVCSDNHLEIGHAVWPMSSWIFFFFLALPHSLWDLSSLTSDWTWGLRSESIAS